MIDPFAVGKRIRAFRRQNRLTQKQLSDLLCVSPQAVSKWERGMSFPDLAYIDLLASALGCSLDALFLGGAYERSNET